MKKIIALILVLTLAATLFAACGSQNDTPAPDTPSDDASG